MKISSLAIGVVLGSVVMVAESNASARLGASIEMPVVVESQHDCTTVVQGLSDLTTQMEQLGDGIVDYKLDSANIISDWYRTLVRNEGRTVRIPFGYYRAIGESPRNLRATAREVDSRFRDLSNELTELTALVAECL